VFERDLDVALWCSDVAGKLALDYFTRDLWSEIKTDGSLVTEADHGVEVRLREDLSDALPGDAILGEEFGLQGKADRVWILDPTDGTSFFAQRDPRWRVHVVLQVEGDFKVAVITAPAVGRQWWAVRGGGAFESTWPRADESPVQLTLSATDSLSRARLDGDNDAARLRLSSFADVAPPTEEGWCGGLIDLVRGNVDCFLSEGHQFWDHAPWRLLVEEAGGCFTKKSGSEFHGGGLYSNAHLHGDLLSAIGYRSNSTALPQTSA
jgi:histidinol-phosphatase